MTHIDNNPAGTREKAADRRVKAFELRKRGASYRAIGRELGVSEKTAFLDVQRALQALAEQEQASAREYRAMELERLDGLALEASRILMTTHPMISGGKVLSTFTASGKAMGLTDDGPKLAAIDRLLRISESRRKLLGLDAPTQIAPVNLDGTPYTPAYLELRTLILQVLPPDARLLLADALDRVIDAPVAERPDDGA